MFEAKEKALAKFKAALDAVRNSKKTPEQIEKAKELYDSLDPSDRTLLEYIFPEVVESEDERIRKEIVDFIRWAIDRGSITKEQRERSDSWLAYLEKQKPSAEEVLIKAGLKPYKDGNQWCILIGDNIQEGICGFGDTIDDALYHLLREAIAYQKEQKPAEWSEEDENKIESIKGLITTGRFVDTNTIRTIWKLLDSLRPQPQWKPSEEQMKALLRAVDDLQGKPYWGYINEVVYDIRDKLM